MKFRNILLVPIIMIFIISCQKQNSAGTNVIKKGMVKVTILYPNDDGKTFDMDYYSKNHMPMLANLFGESLKLYRIDKGIAGRTADEPVPYLAIGYLYFETLEAYQNSFGPNAEKILNDIPNYTNIQPVVQISEIVE